MTLEQTTLTLHSTWRFLVGSAFGAAVLAAAGTGAVIGAGFNVLSTVVFLGGWFFVAVVALDVPLASTFGATGVQRRMLARRQFLAWQPGDALTRTRPSIIGHEARLRQGGLVLRRGRRRYLLVDKAESGAEFAVLLDVLGRPGTPGDLVDVSGLAAPPSSANPTWLYRRRRWRPDGASDR